MQDTPSATSSSDEPRHLVMTVHGIRTFGGWQERLEDLLKAEAGARASEIWITHYKFGYFSVIAFIIPIFRWIVTRRFRKTLEKLAAKRDWDRIDLVGHSFGTHLIGWALRGLPEKSKCSIHTVILSGSVLRMDFPWSDLLEGRVKRVINDCGARDAILLLSQFGVLFTGMAGRVGFTGDTTERFRNRFSLFGHSGYFQDQSRQPSDVYMRERWLNLLLSDGPVPHFDKRPAGVTEGIVTWLAANAEPIKLTFYTAPILALTLWIFTLYQTAETEHRIAEAGRLAALSELRLIKDDNPIDALRLAIQAVQTLGSNQAGDLTFIKGQLQASIAANHARYVFKHEEPLIDAKLAPQGRYLATGTANTVRLWDLETGQPTPIPVQQLSALAFSPAREILAVADQRAIHLLQTTDGHEFATFKDSGGKAQSLVFAPSGRYLATTSGASARIWDVETGSEAAYLWGHSGVVVQAVFSEDGKYLAVAVDDAFQVYIWDVEQAIKGKKLMADRSAGWVDTHGPARQAAFFGKWLVATSETAGVKAWALSDVLNRKDQPITLATGNFVLLSTGAHIAAGSTNGSVHILDIDGATATDLYQLNASRKTSDLIDLTATQVLLGGVVTQNGVTHLQWRGSALLTATKDGGVKIWKQMDKTLIRSREGWVLSSRLRGHKSAIRAASFGPATDSVVTAGADADRNVYVWDTSEDPEVTETDLQKLCALAEARLRDIKKYDGERQVDLQVHCSSPR